MDNVSKIGIIGEFEIKVKDNKGNYKKLWNENKLGKLIREKFGFELRIPLLAGFYLESLKNHNLITNAGFAGVASRINGADSEAAFTYLALGTGTTAATAGDTTLETEITDSGLERAAATASRVTTTETNDTAQLVKTWTATGAKALTELGALNAASDGILLGRQVFAAINVASGNQIEMTYKFPVATA